MPLQFVNIHGQPVNTAIPKRVAKKKPATPLGEKPVELHMGFRVVGIPPESFDEAKDKARRDGAEFDEEAFLSKAKAKPVRRKPYDLHEAAIECATLAGRAGWRRVQIEELKKKG